MRFTPSDLPGLTTGPGHRATAIRAAGLVLAAQGRGHLGGHLEVTSDAPARLGRIPAASERLATVRAVEDALRGGSGTVRLPLPGHWPGDRLPGGRAVSGAPRSGRSDRSDRSDRAQRPDRADHSDHSDHSD
ncbi:hypothetical protein OG875_01740 [Streptomyces sp. NBC_01498]|uniref:hypothetical protein n=1 Tax=Streptomyces sp. NBC_01498 TaxID=2975870 RepID=UPI002E7AE653|nr:hypothetical protein [Streptomyces sp. NBC_01498]WTL23435.1 hypothetical protein OG875_01740 [Streptomyces sp. NBC_01498]